MTDSITLGPYSIGKTLGVGNFSKVKVAIHNPTKGKVAVKYINREKLKSMNMDKKAYREINILRLLNHPNIIRLYEVIESPTDMFVVMEYVAGGELYDYIVSNKKISEVTARRFFQQIISGVSYCHAHMVVHRDLKPENLLLDEHKNVKIADFGLSNIMKDGYFLKTCCGSPNYAAPEVIAGSLYAGPEVDVWSCGVILYAMVCGYLPFNQENIKDLFDKIKKGDYPSPTGVSKGVRKLIKRMLEVDPLKRISLAEISADEWFRKDLPSNLKIYTKKAFQCKDVKVDPKVASQVQRMGYDISRLEEALQIDNTLSKTRKPSSDTEVIDMRQLAVAYHLLADEMTKKKSVDFAKKEKDRRKMSEGKQNGKARLDEKATSEAEGESKKDGKEGSMERRGSFDSSMSSSKEEKDSESGRQTNLDVGLHDVLTTRKFLDIEKRRVDFREIAKNTWNNFRNPLPQDLHASNWALGIRSSSEPSKIMQHIFNSLEVLGMDWKRVSAYRIKARCFLSVPGKSTVKVGIQLYNNVNFAKMHLSKTVASLVEATNSDPWKMYTIDIQWLDGDLFEFFSLFDRIERQLGDQVDKEECIEFS